MSRLPRIAPPAPAADDIAAALDHVTPRRLLRMRPAAHADINRVQDLGFLYSRSLADPDGHVWEAMWMDPAAIPSNDQAG